MRRRIAAGWIATATLMAPLAASAATGTFDRTLRVNGPVLIGLDTGAGDVHVVAGPVSTVHIVGHVHSDHWMGGGTADSRVQQVVAAPPVTQAGNIISIGHNFNENGISIDYEITTPRGTDLRVNSGSGNLQVEGTGGPTDLTTGSGDIQANGLSDHVSLQTGSGNITADLMSARDVKAQSGNGDVTIHNVQGSLWAHTGSGNIDVDGRPLAAAWRVESGSGNVTLDTRGSSFDLNATTGSGDIRYTGANLKQSSTASSQHVIGEVNGGGPAVRVNTGSGNIRVQ